SSTRALTPRIIWKAANGARMVDVEDREFFDYHAAFGPLILGHRHAAVDQAVSDALHTVDLLGVGTTVHEIELSQKLTQHVPSAEKVLLCVTGSESTYHAVRLARAVTGRKKLIKFQGCYHGWHDYVCMNVISSPENIDKYDPGSAGILEESARHTIVVDFNRLDQVEDTLQREKNQIAAIILEPIPHNIGCVLPLPGYLEGLRDLCNEHGVVLIFDEVITGFRHGIGGFQANCKVTPDLTTLAKAMANGYPCAAVCGKRELMDRFQTNSGDVFFAGTYNAHPSSVAAALATIRELEDGSVHERLFRQGDYVAQEISAMIERYGLKAHVAHYGSVFVLYFMEPPVETYRDLLRNDSVKDLQFRRGMIERGCFCLPLPLKRNHISAAHSDEDLARTLQAAEDVLRTMGRN
ncbi:MAG: aspartate aminotransferase family protein, partial [Bryobacteraceae bacterium]|nr:aspartate aminotransferase family protein [Bryobacteraceae bacterium]